MIHQPDPHIQKIVMDLQASLQAEVAGLNELQTAIVTMPHVSAIIGDLTITDVVEAGETERILAEGMAAIENGLNHFMANGFPPSGKALTREKKTGMETISSGLTGVTKEFRLPSRVEVKAEESRKASETWGAFRDVYQNVTRSLLVAVKQYEKGTNPGAPATIAWEKEDGEGIQEQIQSTAKALLLAGIFIKQLYGKALMKAQLEFGHRAYLAAFHDLQNFKVSQHLKAAARRARHSSIDTNKYQNLLQEEQERYLSVVGKWDRECEKRESRRGTGEKVLQEQMKLVDKALGLSHFEAILPQISSVAWGLTHDILSFIPSAKAVEDSLPEHSHEAEEKADSLDDELAVIRERIERGPRQGASMESSYRESTPNKRKGVSFGDEVGHATVSHANIYLETMTNNLEKTHRQAEEQPTEPNIEKLRATIKAVERKTGSMNLNSGGEEDVAEAYTLMAQLDAVSIRASTFVNMEEKKAQQSREEEKSKMMMAAKALPAGKLPAFYGHREDYFEWSSLFQAQCPSSLSSVTRANHLRCAIKDPVTQELIKGCETAEEIERELVRHFGNKSEELARLVAQVDSICMPKNKHDEYSNFQELLKLRRKLRAIREEATLDKLRLTRLVQETFLPKTMEEFETQLYEYKEQLIQEYSINYDQEEKTVRDLALQGKTPELEIPKEEYQAMFWKFLDKKAEVAGRVRGAANATGLIMSSPRRMVVQSNQINPGSPQHRAWPGTSRRCKFQNCGSDEHWSSGCPNLKPGDIPSNIQQLCLDAEVCLRCLRDLSYIHHDKACTGSFRRRSDNQQVETDCRSCTITLPGGRVEKINRRICEHALDRMRARRAQAAGGNTTVNSTNVKGRGFSNW